MMPDDVLPPLADLIAKTPGAQTREQALEHIKARRARLLAQSPIDTRRDDKIAAPEPAPSAESPDDYAAGFWKRLADKDDAKKRPPPRGKKPRLIVDNDDPPKPPKKR